MRVCNAAHLDSVWSICMGYAEFEQRVQPDDIVDVEWRAIWHFSKMIRSAK